MSTPGTAVDGWNETAPNSKVHSCRANCRLSLREGDELSSARACVASNRWPSHRNQIDRICTPHLRNLIKACGRA
jgi:hypothetical protein